VYFYTFGEISTMKKVLLIFFIASISCCSFAQSPPIEWQRCYGGSGSDYPIAIKNDGNGGYVAIGFTSSTNGDVTGNHGGMDFWVLKLAPDGNIQWQKTLGGSNADYGYSIALTNDGGYIVTGTTWSIDGDVSGNHGQRDLWVVKLNAAGNIQWQKTLGGSNAEHARDIEVTNDGGYIITGATYSTDGDVTSNHGQGDVWIVKLDGAGNIEWQKTFGGSSFDDGYSVTQTDDNGYILVAMTMSTDGDMVDSHGGMDTFIVKLNAIGVVEWQKNIGGSGDDRPFGIQCIKDNTNEYVFVGSSSSTNGDVTGNHGNQDYWIVRLGTDGNIVWQKSIGDSGTQYARDFYQTTDGGYILNGVTYTVNGLSLDPTNHDGSWVVKLDSSGNMQWQKILGGTQGDDGSCIQQTPDGGYIVGSETQSSDIAQTEFHGVQDFLIVKLGSQLSTNSFEDEPVTIYPNPVADIINIKVKSLTPISQINIKEITGKLVIRQIGDSDSVNVDTLASGVYVIEVVSGRDKLQYKFIKE
jgi:hypothetical protein